MALIYFFQLQSVKAVDMITTELAVFKFANDQLILVELMEGAGPKKSGPKQVRSLSNN